MSDPFLSEIRIMAFGFPPKGWATCDGQILPVNQNQELFSLLGSTFGGDGKTYFALPDYRGRTPISVSSSHPLGEQGGEAAHTLTIAEMPEHGHLANGSLDVASSQDGAGNLLGVVGVRLYSAPDALTTLHPTAVSAVGQGQPHPNMQPFLTLNFCIALNGLYPSRS